jgi:pyruvate/2-oxoglutarate dehydrogenase complex dihydrolipoamide dehydrogenase (E3) component
MPPVPGLKEYTCTARQVLAGEVEVGKNVVVIGGGLVGAETADHLAVHGHQVTVIEMMPKIMADGEPTPTMLMLRRYAQYGVVTLTSAKVKAIAADSVTYEKDGAEGSVEHVDTIINAMGRRADQSLLKELEGSGYEVISVGDALEAKSGYLGIREGYEAGLRI